MGKAKEIVVSAAERLDAWYNAYTGLGDPLKDAASAASIASVTPFSSTELDALFDDDHLAHKICVSLPTDALRKWVTLKIRDAEGQEGDEILASLERVGVRDALREGLVWARQAGGCLLVLGVDDGQEPDQPLAEDRIRSFGFVNVVRADKASVRKTYEDPTQPKFGEPELWEVRASGRGGAATLVHESRCIRLRGELTTPDKRKERNGWDMSPLQRAKGPLGRNAQSWQALANLLTKSNLLAFGVKGYTNMVRQLKAAAEAFAGRMQLARMAQSINSWTVYDADGEKVENIAVNFGGISDAMDRMMMEAASAADMPVTKMWGRSPAGLNATGDSDLQLWEQQVEGYQSTHVRPALERLVQLAMLTDGSATGGAEPESWSLEFNPLRVMTDEQLAAVQLNICQAVALLITNEVVTPEEVALGPLFGDTGLLNDLARVDQDAREAILAADLERMVTRAENPPTPPTPPAMPTPPMGGPMGGE